MQGATDARGTAHSRNILLRQRQKCAGRRPPRIERKHWKCTENKKRPKGEECIGLFDFDGDGKISLWEDFLEYSLFEEYANDGTGEPGIGLFADDHRDDCKDGSEYGIDPWDYDTLEEYEEALEDARLRQLSDGL